MLVAMILKSLSTNQSTPFLLYFPCFPILAAFPRSSSILPPLQLPSYHAPSVFSTKSNTPHHDINHGRANLVLLERCLSKRTFNNVYLYMEGKFFSIERTDYSTFYEFYVWILSLFSSLNHRRERRNGKDFKLQITHRSFIMLSSFLF